MTKPKPRPEPQRRVASIHEAMHTTDLSQATIYRLIDAGKLATVKIGRRRLIPIEAIEALLRGGAK